MRVMFIDDEPNILSGLRRILRPLRDQWQMQFADGGQAALDSLADAPCDVIVSDMKMPGMDGAELLSAVKKKYPTSIRIALSGEWGLRPGELVDVRFVHSASSDS